MSPLISLFLPGNFRDHAYRDLIYRTISDRETKGIKDKEQIVLILFDYVHNHIFRPVNRRPYDGKVLDYLISGVGWCDYHAKTLAALLSKKEIPARYAMLVDKNGISPHTVGEVFLDEEWRFFDPFMNLFFKKDDGSFATVEEVCGTPELISNHPKLQIASRQNPDLPENLIKLYKRISPVSHPPRRSSPRTKGIQITDRIADIYVFVFGHYFADNYQDIYLFFRTKSLEEEDYKLFFLARNYHLLYRKEIAVRHYNELLNKYPDSKYADDSLFFLAMLYAELEEDFASAIETYEYLFSKYPNSEWEKIAYYYTGLAYEKAGNIQKATDYYMKSNRTFDVSMRLYNLEKIQ